MKGGAISKHFFTMPSGVEWHLSIARKDMLEGLKFQACLTRIFDGKSRSYHSSACTDDNILRGWATDKVNEVETAEEAKRRKW